MTTQKKDNNCIYICLLNRLKIALLMTWYTWNKYAVVSFSSINLVPSQAQRPPWRSPDLFFFFPNHPPSRNPWAPPPASGHARQRQVFPAIGCLPGGRPHVNELRCLPGSGAGGRAGCQCHGRWPCPSSTRCSRRSRRGCRRASPPPPPSPAPPGPAWWAALPSCCLHELLVRLY